mgnify:CR=1 FL=1
MSNLLAFAQNMIRQNQGNIPNTPYRNPRRAGRYGDWGVDPARKYQPV